MQPSPKADIFYGAQIDLQTRITCNLFLLCPNNSGSTFLSKAIGTSPDVWSLPREGQHALGYVGAITQNENGLTWAASQSALERVTNPKDFDWAQNQKTWYFQAQARSDKAKVFFTKAPPFLAYPEMLAGQFANTRFVIMVRNPYAMIEGIMRGNSRLFADQNQLLDIAVDHTLACLHMQRRNQETYTRVSCFFTYEEMCRAPDTIAQKIKTLIPEIATLTLDQKLPVKQHYDEPLRDMNDAQIARLSPEQFERISNRLKPHASLLAHFGYGILC